ncbi:MAG: hypothetical protein HYX92_21550 [Chloroflexi bacterium]|nr:hypothetical protein [Chloroflexota bacterium]
MNTKAAAFSSMACILTLLGLLVASCAPAAAPAATKAPLTPAPAPTVQTGAAPTPAPKAAGPRTGGVLTVAKRLPIPHLDMHQEITVNMQAPLAPVYSWLIQNDPIGDENKIIGDLAKSWDITTDGLTYTFKLQDGVKFHDGRPLTSTDVKASLDRIIFPPRGVVSPRQGLYTAVDKIETPDALTVKISLKRVQGSFLQLLALQHNFIFPAHILKEKGDMKRDVVGTGPFKFVSEMRGVSFKTQRNPEYFVKGLPYLDGVTYYEIPDDRSRIGLCGPDKSLCSPPGWNPAALK